MKIALFGYGKMGKLLEDVAMKKYHQISAKFSNQLGNPHERIEEVEQADLVIDFSVPSATLSHLQLCLKLGKPLIIGTTGWEDQLSLARNLVEEQKGRCLYAPNFAIGVILFQKIVSFAASLFQDYEEFDVSGIEQHHRHKRDQPSGTAKLLRKIILEQMPRVQNIDFAVVRSGSNPGTHTIQFDSPSDTVTLTHQARNKLGFAEGAILAGEWLMQKQQYGFFSINDFINDPIETGAL